MTTKDLTVWFATHRSWIVVRGRGSNHPTIYGPFLSFDSANAWIFRHQLIGDLAILEMERP